MCVIPSVEKKAAWQLSKALYTAKENGWHRFDSMQNHYNLIYREDEREIVPLCIDQGVALIPWSPLARGFLRGRAAGTAAAERSLKKTPSDARERLANRRRSRQFVTLNQR